MDMENDPLHLTNLEKVAEAARVLSILLLPKEMEILRLLILLKS